ncbi:hypothetical protein [Streptomyces sp. NRRL S-4]|uniref:hypothetical protein n=1 Tax=Streptomyces sp. NRRL S-4 TaxID=1519471 RepID=UPI00131C4D8A|nr:hypothetical protein [Streptomyces sp. NRRL S-4]
MARIDREDPHYAEQAARALRAENITVDITPELRDERRTSPKEPAPANPSQPPSSTRPLSEPHRHPPQRPWPSAPPTSHAEHWLDEAAPLEARENAP